MSKYRVGEKVRVKEDLETFEFYTMDGHPDIVCCFMRSMSRLKGQTVTIKNVYKFGYTIEEDGGACGWSDGMFESFKNDYVVGDKVKLTDGLTQERTGIPQRVIDSLSGKTLTIAYIDKDGDYYLDEASDLFCWSADWLELVSTREDYLKSLMVTGRIGKTVANERFVVVDDHVVYEHGGWDWVNYLVYDNLVSVLYGINIKSFPQRTEFLKDELAYKKVVEYERNVED